MSDYHNSIEFRRISVSFLSDIADMVAFCAKELGIDAIDWYVYSCAAMYSAQYGTIFKQRDPNFDKRSNYTHGVINAKSIYLTLGMPRETVRKRLVYLETRGAIKKIDGGYSIHETSDLSYYANYGIEKAYLNIRNYFCL